MDAELTAVFRRQFPIYPADYWSREGERRRVRDHTHMFAGPNGGSRAAPYDLRARLKAITVPTSSAAADTAGSSRRVGERGSEIAQRGLVPAPATARDVHKFETQQRRREHEQLAGLEGPTECTSTIDVAVSLRAKPLDDDGRRRERPRLPSVALCPMSSASSRPTPDLVRVAHWTAQGLTAYDAAYVAVAEHLGTPLVIDDDLIIEIAHEIARPLSVTPG